MSFYGSSTFAGQVEDRGPERHRGHCGKACYGSRGAAERSVRTLQKRGRDEKYRGYLHAYVCKSCRAWHVGHTSFED